VLTHWFVSFAECSCIRLETTQMYSNSRSHVTFEGSCWILSTECACYVQWLESCSPLSVLQPGSHADDSTRDIISIQSLRECGVHVECCHRNCSRGTRRSPCLLRHIRHGQTDETSIFCRISPSVCKSVFPLLLKAE